VCCSNKCTRTIYKTKHRKQKLSHLCPECGKDTNRAKYCSIICLKRATNRNKAKSPARKLKANLRRPHSYGRCKRLGLPVEQVDPLRVFWRDKWKCQLCGTETPMSLRGTCNDKAPELDHINPISKGGGHTYENTQCLCRSCNAWKKDMPLVSYNVVLQARSEIRAIFGD
jgi:5-methylcytosine-specific restriction endonuclease McrA